MKYILFGCFGLLLWSSCSKILLKSYGIKQPVLENYHSLKTYLETNKIDAQEILVFKDTIAFHKYLSSKPSIPDASFYNKDKKFVDYRTPESDCNGKVDLFIEQIDQINNLAFNNLTDLDSLLADLVYAESKQPFLGQKSRETEAYVVIFWAKYLGKLNRTKVYEWQQKWKEIHKENPNIRLIKINVDYQELWNINEKDIPKYEF